MSEELNTLIGQMLLVGFKGKELSSEMKDVIKRNKIGNVILFSENIENMEQLAKLTADIRATILEATGWCSHEVISGYSPDSGSYGDGSR